jgi:hypothetical protein
LLIVGAAGTMLAEILDADRAFLEVARSTPSES